jgi:D-psicose/D-tagatose/L-ribulose 3-epimerase
MNKLSIHSYCLIPAWTTESGAVAVDKAARAGFGHLVVPTKDHAAIDPPAITRMFAQAGLKPIATATQLPQADIASTDHAVWAAGLERHRLSLRLARDMGAVHMGGILYSVFGKATGPAPAESFARVAEALAQIADEAAGFGMRLAIEIVNRYETNLINTVDQGLAMLRLVGAKNLHLHLDTFHMNIEEADPLAALERALPHVAYFELDQSDRGPLDRGAIDFAPLLACLKRGGYCDLIGVEAFSSAVSSPAVAAGVGAWRNLFDDGDVVAQSAMRVLARASLTG